MDWNDYLNEYEAYIKFERNLANNTYISYIQDISKFIKYLKESENLTEANKIKTEHLKDFIEYINSMGVSVKSQERIISGLKSFFKFMLIEDYITENPIELISSPRTSRSLPDVLSVEEIDLIINSIDLSHKLGHRNRAIIEVLYSCGLRVSELTDLKISNIFFTQGFVKVIGKGNKQRLVPIGNHAKKEIKNYMLSFRNHINAQDSYKDYLFLNHRGKKLTRVMIFTIIKEACKLAGIKKNVSPHTFRHSFATHLIEGGADLRIVQEMLGHESITTTEIYTHIDKNFLRETIIQYHPRS